MPGPESVGDGAMGLRTVGDEHMSNSGEAVTSLWSSAGFAGGIFNPLGFGKDNIAEWKLKEIKNARLAMLACAGFFAQVLQRPPCYLQCLVLLWLAGWHYFRLARARLLS